MACDTVTVRRPFRAPTLFPDRAAALRIPIMDFYKQSLDQGGTCGEVKDELVSNGCEYDEAGFGSWDGCYNQVSERSSRFVFDVDRTCNGRPVVTAVHN